MTPLRAFFVVCLLGFIVWCIFEIVKLQKMPEPTPGKACDPNQVWADSSCATIKELKFDPTIVSPAGKSMSLLAFEAQGTSIQPIYNPVWYRFRYVNVVTGGYSNFSDWTLSPVMSGSCCLPCVGGVGQCDSSIGNGYTTCKANMPTLGVEQTVLDYPPLAPVDANGTAFVPSVHRYTNPPGVTTKPSSDVKDEVVGVMDMMKTVSGKNYYTFMDWKYPACGSSDTGDTGKCSKSNSLCNRGNVMCDVSTCNQ
jgi:hypothetical protein